MNRSSADQPRPVPGATNSAAAARLARLPAQQNVPTAPGALMAEPGSLVARALAILAEEAQAWHARQDGPLPPRSTR